jgi:hypothetical protein
LDSYFDQGNQGFNNDLQLSLAHLLNKEEHVFDQSRFAHLLCDGLPLIRSKQSEFQEL